MEPIRGGALALLLLLVAALSSTASAQTNNGPYPIGTRCRDLQEPHRSRCREALDPRPNPQELLNRRHPGAILPEKPSRRGDLDFTQPGLILPAPLIPLK
ncbi:MAG: hypothetical protein JNL25_07525 [Rhodospirillaceae bacterium]|nr:hypothetical protein [Rhodospirillaceae bacterium]